MYGLRKANYKDVRGDQQQVIEAYCRLSLLLGDRSFFIGQKTKTPINVKAAEMGVGGRQSMGWGFDIFQKFAVKFPAHGQIIPVNCNQISPPRAPHCCPSQGWTQERHNKNISK